MAIEQRRGHRYLSRSATIHSIDYRDRRPINYPAHSHPGQGNRRHSGAGIAVGSFEEAFPPNRLVMQALVHRAIESSLRAGLGGRQPVPRGTVERPHGTRTSLSAEQGAEAGDGGAGGPDEGWREKGRRRLAARPDTIALADCREIGSVNHG